MMTPLMPPWGRRRRAGRPEAQNLCRVRFTGANHFQNGEGGAAGNRSESSAPAIAKIAARNVAAAERRRSCAALAGAGVVQRWRGGGGACVPSNEVPKRPPRDGREQHAPFCCRRSPGARGSGDDHPPRADRATITTGSRRRTGRWRGAGRGATGGNVDDPRFLFDAFLSSRASFA